MPSIDAASAPSERPRPKDAYLGLHFWVEIGGIQIASFAECSGLNVETEIIEYIEGGQNTYTHKLPVRTKYANITLKRGIDEGQDFYRWYMSTLDGKTQRKDISIILYNPVQKEVWRWDLKRAFPIKWTGPDMKADAGAVAVETVEIVHEGFNTTSGNKAG